MLILASGVAGFFAAGADIKLMNGASPADFAGYGQALRDTFDRITGHGPWRPGCEVSGAAGVTAKQRFHLVAAHAQAWQAAVTFLDAHLH
ncbi:MAG: hypothetical protein ABJB47_04725 [Actinomycetota bacterium]